MNQEYIEKGREVLRVLNANGYEAFFQGKGLEQMIENKDVDHLDIITSADIEQIKAIFIGHVKKDSDSRVDVAIDSCYFSIFPFMKNEDLEIVGDLVHYSRGLYEDMSRRDFTLECVIMSHSGNIKDFYKGARDLERHVLVPIKKAKLALRERPIIGLRALSLMASGEYTLSSKLKKVLRNKSKYLRHLSLEDELLYLKGILNGANSKKVIKFIDKADLENNLPHIKKVFKKMLSKKVYLNYEDFLALYFVSIEQMDEDKLIGIENIEIFKKVYNVALTNPKCKFDTLTMYSAGASVLSSVIRINKVLHNTHAKESKVMEAYDALPIKKTCDLAFKGEDILSLCEGANGEAILMLVDNIVYQVLNGNLANEYEAIKAYCVTEINKNPELYASTTPVYPTCEEPLEYPKVGIEEKETIVTDIENRRLDLLEKRLEEQTKTIEEKNKLIEQLLANGNSARMYSDVNQLVNDCITRLKELNYLQDDDYAFESKLREMLMNHLTRKDQ